MAAAEGPDSYCCPGCQAVEARKSLVARDYRCSHCGLQVAHLDRGPDGAVRQVVGWLHGRGEVLHGRYQVRSAIGSGGFAATYLVDDLLLKGKCWAVKEISTIQYDESEADLLSRLNHPAIPDIVDRFQSDAMVYLVLRFGGDHTLDDERKACGGAIPVAKLVPWLVQLLDVVSYLHGRTPPVVHRDLKPDNILIDQHGKVALVDFGIAKESSPQTRTRTIAQAWSHGFSPPEQVLGTGTDQRSDVYSLGATMYVLLTGVVPPPAHERLAGTELIPPSQFNPDLPQRLEAAIVKALDLNINRRPQTIQELREALAIDSAVSATVRHDAPLYERTVRLPASTRESTGSVAVRETSKEKAAVSSTALETPREGRPHIRSRRRVARTVTTTALLLLLTLAGFAGAYVYSQPEILSDLGTQHLLNFLPWRRAALAAARGDPLEFSYLSLALCNAEGTLLSSPKESFTDVEIGKAGHLQWIASFKNKLAGLEDRKEAVSAQFFDPKGSPVASSSAERVVDSNDKSASFSAVAADFTGHPLGRYRVVLSSGDKRLAEREFYVTEDLAAKAAAEAAKAQAEAAKEKDAPSVGPPANGSVVRHPAPVPDPALSNELSEYLHHQRLPYVYGLVLSNRSGRPSSLVLSGSVRTQMGKQDAEQKSRDFLGNAQLGITDNIKIDSALAKGSSVPPEGTQPSTTVGQNTNMPAAATAPNVASGTVAAGLPSVLGGVLENSIGQVISGASSAGSAPVYSPPPHTPQHR